MGTITLYQKRAKASSGWGGWGTISGADYVSTANNAYVVYSAAVNLGTSSSLNSVTVGTNFVCRTSGATHGATVGCLLYDFDPTGGSTFPAGYLGFAQAAVTVPYYGVYQTFTFDGLNITSNKTLYFWFLDANESPYPDDLYSTATGNGYTGTPAVIGNFTAGVQTLTISPSSVNTGSSVTISVSNATGSLTATIKYGSTVLDTKSFTGGSTSIPCPASWFATAGVTALTEITLSVTVTGGAKELSGSFTLTAGADMGPAINSVSTELVQGNTASAFSDYIANISRAKLKISVSAKAGASIRTVTVNHNGTSLNARLNEDSGLYEVTTIAPLTGDTDFPVTVIDSRDMTCSATFRLSGVKAYQLPSLTVDAAYRCNSAGAETNGGTHYRIKARANIFTELSGNVLTEFICRLKGTGNSYDLSSGVLSGALDGSLQPKSSYKVEIIVTDSISSITREIPLSGMLRNVVITRSDDGTYVGIGKTPEKNSGGSSVELPAEGEIIVGDAIFSHNRLVLGSASYGTEEPENAIDDPVEGQIYFMLVE